MNFHRPLLVLVTSIICILAIPSSASATEWMHQIDCDDATSFVCDDYFHSIGTVAVTGAISGRDLSASLVWHYTSLRSGRVWNVAKLRTRCKSTSSTAVAYATKSRKIYQNLQSGWNRSYWRGPLAIKTTCPSGYRARSYTISGGVYNYTSSGGVGRRYAKFT